MNAKEKDDLASRALARAVKASAPAAKEDAEEKPEEGNEGEAAAFDQFMDAFKAGNKKAGMRALKTFIAACRDYEPGEN